MPRETTSLPPGMEPRKWKAGNLLRWQEYTAHNKSGIHVVPENDDRIHSCVEECFCAPQLNQHGVWIHNSFDCREEYSEGYRKRH